MKYLSASLTIQEPINKLMDKKCNQKINKNDSSENTEYKFSKPRYKSKPSKIFPFK